MPPMVPMVPIGRLYAEAFWLTVEAREDGSAGTGGAAVEVVVLDVVVLGIAVEVDGTGIEAAAPVPAPARSQGLGGEAMTQGNWQNKITEVTGGWR